MAQQVKAPAGNRSNPSSISRIRVAEDNQLMQGVCWPRHAHILTYTTNELINYRNKNKKSQRNKQKTPRKSERVAYAWNFSCWGGSNRISSQRHSLHVTGQSQPGLCETLSIEILNRDGVRTWEWQYFNRAFCVYSPCLFKSLCFVQFAGLCICNEGH